MIVMIVAMLLGFPARASAFTATNSRHSPSLLSPFYWNRLSDHYSTSASRANKLRVFQSTRTVDSIDYSDETPQDNLKPGNNDELLLFSSNTTELDSTSTTIIPAPVAALLADSEIDVVSLWKRRLITHEDPFSIHKWSSLVYTFSSIVILGTATMVGLTDALTGTANVATIPDFLAPWTYAFVVSNTILCAASVPMAWIHRKGDLTARNAFLGTAVSSLFSGFFGLWLSPFAPSIMVDVHWFNQACFAVLCLLNAYFIVDTMIQTPQVVEGRRDRKVEPGATRLDQHPLRYWRDALGYVLPIAWGLPVIGSTGYQASWAHDRAWMMHYFDHITATTGFPFVASAFYLQILASLAASYGALFVTLRDKKLITKQQELVGITLFSVPAMIWTIYVTIIFYQNL